MIVSHDHQFIFVKNRKTAGTSIEIAISRYAGPLDIVTRLGPEDEAKRLQEGRYPQNFESVEALRPEQPMENKAEVQEYIRANKTQYATRQSFFNHMTAVEIRDAVGPEIWERYHSFCLERIPYDRLLSSFHFKKARRKGLADVEFPEYIRIEDEKLENWRMYTGPDGIMVDQIIPYHRRTEELHPLLARFGIVMDRPLPRAKGQFRKDHRHWSEVISPEDRAYIDANHAREFDALEMTPDEAWNYGL